MKYKVYDVYDGRDFLGECETISTLNDLLLKLKKSKKQYMLNFDIFGREYYTSCDYIDVFLINLKSGLLLGFDICKDIYNNINNEIEFTIKNRVVYIRVKDR